MTSRYLWKLYAGYAVLILLSAGMVGWLVARHLEQRSLSQTDQHLYDEAVLLGALVIEALTNKDVWVPDDEPAPKDSLQNRVDRLGHRIGTRMTVVRVDGIVLADSEKQPHLMDNHGRRPEILLATELGVGKSSRFSNTLDINMRYLAIPLRDEAGELLGWARTSLPLAGPSEEMVQLRRAVLTGALTAILVAMVLGYFLARRITEPLQSMALAADSIASGEYAQKVPIYSRDELGQLGHAFNTMSRKLRDSIEAIHSDRAKLAAILEGMVEGVIAVDREERILHINRVAERLLHIDAEGALGKPIWQVCRVQQISDALTDAMMQKEIIQSEIRRPGANDQIIELRASPLQNGTPTPIGAVLLLEDVTSLQRLETMRRDFVGNVSHELKTPVAAIQGMVETMIDDPDMPPKVRRSFLDKITKQAERLSHLVTDLLSLSRLQASSHVLPLEPIDLRETVADCLGALQQRSEARAVEVIAELPAHPVIADGEDEALQQAVTNLIDNAINYSPRGGQVRVRLITKEREAVIEIADRGIGIAPRDLERIFERFYRVDKARSREVGGTGLGLAIVKHLVQALNGRVSVESQLGEGSTFRIHLPTAR